MGGVWIFIVRKFINWQSAVGRTLTVESNKKGRPFRDGPFEVRYADRTCLNDRQEELIIKTVTRYRKATAVACLDARPAANDPKHTLRQIHCARWRTCLSSLKRRSEP